ncbi:hypothetical protein LCGC14_2374520 [marine sediment metagenome]|uniref:Uncharacterized protein n=1 Tax=marine sediment metagenome TaxID=412755 RepID=A0A0F9EXE7_9ZZZZ
MAGAFLIKHPLNTNRSKQTALAYVEAGHEYTIYQQTPNTLALIEPAYLSKQEYLQTQPSPLSLCPYLTIHR